MMIIEKYGFCCIFLLVLFAVAGLQSCGKEEEINADKRNALLVIDVQNDFLPGGSLEVKDGDKIIPVINAIQKHFDLVVATQDWHPADHESFAVMHPGKNIGNIILLDGAEQILWPEHCVQNGKGAEFPPELDTSGFDEIFYKGLNKHVDSYSGFFDNRKGEDTGLGDYLKRNNVGNVYIVGLASDYCVKFTVLDALDLEFNTFVIADACRGVNLKEGDVERAFEEMAEKGAHVISSKELLNLR